MNPPDEGLMNILNTMYNNNLREIHEHQMSINRIQSSNIQIRDRINDLLINRQSRNRSRRYNNQRRNINRYNYNNTIYRNPFTLLQNFFEPIEIYPTQTQIENATRVVLYGDIVNPNNTSCPISLEPFNDNNTVSIIRHCGHIFHTNELLSWFNSNCRCPVCRYDIRDSNASNVNPLSNVNQSPTVNRSPTVTERNTNTTDVSGNLIHNITDILFNSFLNGNGGTGNGAGTGTGNESLYNSIFFDILIDPSMNNITRTPYYTFPLRRTQ